MSELNQETQAQTSQSTPKTYMERLIDMESKLVTHSNILNQAQVVYEFLSKVTTDLVETIRTLDDQLNAVYELSEEGKMPTKQNVEQKLKDKVEKSLRDLVDQRVASKFLTPIESVLAKENLVTYSKKDVPYAFRIVSALDTPELADSAIGKKVGDLVGDMTILGIYQVNQQNSQQAEPATVAPTADVQSSDQQKVANS